MLEKCTGWSYKVVKQDNKKQWIILFDDLIMFKYSDFWEFSNHYKDLPKNFYEGEFFD
jgi:hypothetical protein